MRKNKVVVSNPPARRSGRSDALQLSRETIRTLTAEDLVEAGGGVACPTTTSTTQVPAPTDGDG